MNLIQKFIRKNVNDVLKEGEVYTIKKDELKDFNVLLPNPYKENPREV